MVKICKHFVVAAQPRRAVLRFAPARLHCMFYSPRLRSRRRLLMQSAMSLRWAGEGGSGAIGRPRGPSGVTTGAADQIQEATRHNVRRRDDLIKARPPGDMDLGLGAMGPR